MIHIISLTICSLIFTVGSTTCDAPQPLHVQLTDETLISVSVIHRHGDRTPLQPLPKDPYKDVIVGEDGIGQLIIKGKKRMFNLGVRIRQKYRSFLEPLNPLDVRVLSSGKDRTLQSVSCLLTGAYPSQGRWTFNDIQWQPFSIMTRTPLKDGIMNPDSLCPAADRETERIHSLPEVAKVIDGFKKLFPFIAKNTGRNVTQLEDAEDIYDVLLIEEMAGIKLPSWVTPEVEKQLIAMYHYYFYIDYSTPEVRRLRTGQLFNDLLKRFRSHQIPLDQFDYTNYDERPRKLNVYSTHDNMMSAVLLVLGDYNMLPPPYGATIFIELHNVTSMEMDGGQSDLFIRSFYLNVTETGEMYPVTLGLCGGNMICSLNQFEDALKDTIITSEEEWTRECV